MSKFLIEQSIERINTKLGWIAFNSEIDAVHREDPKTAKSKEELIAQREQLFHKLKHHSKSIIND
jgi:hypothetical protein